MGTDDHARDSLQRLVSLAARWRVRADTEDATASDNDPSPLSTECRCRAKAMRELANELDNEIWAGSATACKRQPERKETDQ